MPPMLSSKQLDVGAPQKAGAPDMEIGRFV